MASSGQHNGAGSADRHLQIIPSEQPMPSPSSTGPIDAQRNNAPATRRTNTSGSAGSGPGGMLRRTSATFMNSDPPLGFLSALGSTAAAAPTMGEIRGGEFTESGWNSERQIERRRSSTSSTGRGIMGRSGSSFSGKDVGRGIRSDTGRSDTIHEHSHNHETIDTHAAPMAANGGPPSEKKESAETELTTASTTNDEYVTNPKLPWTTTWAIGLIAFWKWFTTPLGFCITIYGLNVVAWGGMLFLLLCNASPAMCKPTCNDINSPRRVWIEIDSQILNALFCVTGFGLIPWRFRDLYWLMVFRLGIRGRSKEARMVGLRRLAGINRGWFRLPGCDKPAHERETYESEEMDPTVPLPVEKRLDEPLTGVRAPPTALWRLDYVIWMNCWNTFLQVCLCVFMWGFNRIERPSWSTGLFVALACIVAALAGVMMWTEGKKVKKVEGVAPKVFRRVADAENDLDILGNTKYKAVVPPKEKKIKKEKREKVKE
ncbi:hypothetical protein EJ08DRAFT_639341 [Tothia fuscella]|uniref:Uncharacterized protein n=1 Tax=Tothia fuscella TaxID=1048955 RepID=A0A9P4NJV0_9PEZI|nr:hypothetical protein EJ08DRAFT_639341 [Tothia fuscella]